MSTLPKKLKVDAIVESVLEIRFEGSIAPELVMARLIDNGSWANFKDNRLPISEIPEQIRVNDAGLKFQPHFILENEQGPEVVKIGPNMISCSYINKYRGWENFSVLISEMLHVLFKHVKGVKIKRLGLRYVNALSSEKHNVKSIDELKYSIMLQEKDIARFSSLTYKLELSEDHIVLTKIVSPEFIISREHNNAIAFVDIDVSTKDVRVEIGSTEDAMSWIEQAHDFEKEVFFGLLPEEIIKDLMVD